MKQYLATSIWFRVKPSVFYWHWVLDTRYWQLFLPGDRNRRRHQIHDRQRQQKLPAERHQLIVTEARQRPAHPDVKKEKTENLGAKPEQRQQRSQQRWPKQRPMPSSKKQ